MDKYEGPSAHRPDDSGKSATESLDDDIIRHYLVGDLLEEEQQLEIEEAYLLDDDFFERVVAIRDDLLDDYRRGELSETELGRVRDMLDSSPALLDQLAFAEALERSLSSRRSPKPDSEHLPGRSLDRRLTISKLAGPRTPATVLLLLLVVSGTIIGVLSLRVVHLHNEVEQAKRATAALENKVAGAEQKLSAERANSHQLADRLAQAEKQLGEASPAISGESRVAVFVLQEGEMDIGHPGRPLVIQPEAKQVRLIAHLERSDFNTYNATLRTAAGGVALSLNRLKPRRGLSRESLTMTIPPNSLKTGQYVLLLRGVDAGGASEDVATYLLNITKK